ncbi:hypothetical protein Dsin_010237 [Dipteronia sinensis]|uniref:Uncharacterized protein n=1 Tax=Dipteronia sinensis TaxID=43782 RepID=A0AAE0ATA2_9ROSI|nr:hypothetical protein Dsin_010237 [Dipteronia sinensis]
MSMTIGGSSAKVSPDVPSSFEDYSVYPELNDYQVETQGSHEQVIRNAAIETAQMAIGGSSAEVSLDVPFLFEDYSFYPELKDYPVETQGSHELVIQKGAIEPAQMAIGVSSAEASLDVPFLFEDYSGYLELNDYQVETQGSQELVIHNAAIELLKLIIMRR